MRRRSCAGYGGHGGAPKPVIPRSRPWTGITAVCPGLSPGGMSWSPQACRLHLGSPDGRPGGPGRTARAGDRPAAARLISVAALPDVPRPSVAPEGSADLGTTGRPVRQTRDLWSRHRRLNRTALTCAARWCPNSRDRTGRGRDRPRCIHLWLNLEVPGGSSSWGRAARCWLPTGGVGDRPSVR